MVLKMAQKITFLCIALLCVSVAIFAQENIETNVARSLQECYKEPDLINANQKLPMTMNVLIDLIRKIENGPTLMDLRVLSTSMLHRFRQDGIRKASTMENRMVLPYSPVGHENDKFKIVLQNLVPGNPVQFPNDTLTSLERCALHLMISEVVELLPRVNEVEECRQVGKYVSRVGRDLKDDVEIIFTDDDQTHSNNAQQKKFNVDTNILNSHSICPLEYGVVYTKWGSVSAGYVLAGIAAGTEPQDVDISDIINTGATQKIIDNIWGATLAGDIAELGYLAVGNNQPIIAGNQGDWDSRYVPHSYYIKNNEHIFMTDAEIRGDLDGLILGTQIKKYSYVRSMKLSQLLDMYYSSKGVFQKDIRACSRGSISKKFATTEEMKTQGTTFGNILNKYVRTQSSLDEDAVEKAVNEAVRTFDSYLATLNDLSCIEDAPTASTDILIYLDCSWNFQFIYNTLSFFLDELDINPYNSNFTLINSQDGSLILNSSYSILEFHEVFNETTYQKQARGFDLTLVVKHIEDTVRQKMDQERIGPEAGGKSMIALLVTQTNNFDDTDKNYVIEKIRDTIEIQLPDLKMMALTSGSKDNFENIVKDTSRDVFTISESISDIMPVVTNTIKRIKEIPKRIINLNCGPDWVNVGDVKNQLLQFVEPKGVNYYRIHPNYFFGDDTRKIKIRGQGSGPLTVCHSRTVELPRAKPNQSYNKTKDSEDSKDEVVCKPINSDEFVIELENPCSGASKIRDCEPIFISVEASQDTQTGMYVVCKDKGCRFPDNLKYTISLDNFGCYSSAYIYFTNICALVSMLFILFARNHFLN